MNPISTKLLLIEENQKGFYENNVTSSLTFIQRPGNY